MRPDITQFHNDLVRWRLAVVRDSVNSGAGFDNHLAVLACRPEPQPMAYTLVGRLTPLHFDPRHAAYRRP